MRIIANGVFDLFHEGHKHLLNQAVKMAGEIFILLNTDSSAHKLKGPGKPSDNFGQRWDNIQAYLGGMKAFCRPNFHIIPFDSEAQLKMMIDSLAPDMILKGNDRPDVRDIVGSDKWPVCIIPRLKDKDGQDISTTRMIEEHD